MLWSLTIFRELCLLLEVDCSPSLRTHLACSGRWRPWLCHCFGGSQPWEHTNQWAGQLWIWHLPPISWLTLLLFPNTRGKELFLELAPGKVWHLLLVWHSNCPSWRLILRTTWGTCLLIYSCSHPCSGCQSVCLSALEVQLAFFLTKAAPNLLFHTLVP